jgi:hypothetical protein
MSFDTQQFIALILSIVIEGIFVAIWAQIWKLNGRSLVVVASASTLITHPILWQVFIDLSSGLSFPVLSLLEIPVVLFEGGMYRWVTGYPWLNCFGLSLGANLTSYIGGLLVYQLQQ